jgi:hypothetical protein
MLLSYVGQGIAEMDLRIAEFIFAEKSRPASTQRTELSQIDTSGKKI